MGEAEVIMEDKVYETKFSFQDKQQKPTNLLHRFSSDNLNTHVFNPNKMRFKPQEVDDDLNLKLSLGGIYSTIGNGNPKENPLTRSSSIAGSMVNNKNCRDHHQLEKWVPKSFLALARSCSLPVQMESRRTNNNRVVNVKELRVVRRVEAKKRVVEKLRNAEKEKLVMEGPPSSPTQIPAWPAASKIKEGFKQLEGLEGTGTPNSPNDGKSFSKTIKAEPAITFETTSNSQSVKLRYDETGSENPIKKAKLSNGCIQDGEMGIIKKMPSVTTTGDGPNGRKIDGFLYKYMKGHVSIVCVCHGNFLSPEEFVKHAGGKDVTNPMRHINVSANPFS